jgi:Ca-activated chloride channel family protein
MKRALFILFGASLLVLVFGTVRNTNFWRTPEQKGDALLRAGRFAEAARVYVDPAHIGIAQYRNGDFEGAAKTFARVPGALGAYDQGNAWLMHGKYEAAIASYDRALSFRHGWRMAEENRALAQARKTKLEAGAEHRAEEQANAYKPDEIVFDQKGDNRRGQPTELAQGDDSDEGLRAMWLRNVQTTPGDFLRAKFAWQASQPAPGGEGEEK